MLAFLATGMLDAPPATHLVPAVTGYTQAVAESLLLGSGYDAAAIFAENAEFVPGTVYDQSPAAHTSLAPGETVTIYVAVAPSSIYETVPYLIGYSQTGAEYSIRSIYCIPSVVGTTGTVTAQSPAAFTQVPRGTTIQITLGGEINAGQGFRRGGLPPYGSRE